MGVRIASTTDDDCKRLRDATDSIEEGDRERSDAVRVCEEDAIIIKEIDERTREISLVSFSSVSKLFIDLERTRACTQ